MINYSTSNEKTTMSFGINTSIENRIGGDIRYVEGKGDSTHILKKIKQIGIACNSYLNIK
jgi:hypothetical protein